METRNSTQVGSHSHEDISQLEFVIEQSLLRVGCIGSIGKGKWPKLPTVDQWPGVTMAKRQRVRGIARQARKFVRFACRRDVDDAPRLVAQYLKLRILEQFVPAYQRPVRLAGFQVYYTDLETLRWLFEEIFIDRDYEPPTGSVIRSIVDAGANIGLSTLYFRQRFPDAIIECFEPDPR